MKVSRALMLYTKSSFIFEFEFDKRVSYEQYPNQTERLIVTLAVS